MQVEQRAFRTPGFTIYIINKRVILAAILRNSLKNAVASSTGVPLAPILPEAKLEQWSSRTVDQ
jgi:hypothetical protein